MTYEQGRANCLEAIAERGWKSVKQTYVAAGEPLEDAYDKGYGQCLDEMEPK